MYRPIRHILSALLILLTFGSITSQTRTYSPFSRYGLGELNDRGYGSNNSMGGVGIGIRNANGLNSLNPASYSAMDSMSFFLEVGLSGHSQSLKSGEQSQNFSDIDFDYFAFGFPIHRKVGISIGIMPAAQAGYQFQTKGNTIEPTLQTSIGAGNITSLFGGVGYEIIPNLSVGANASFWFGNVYHKSYAYFTSSPDARVYGVKNEHKMSSLLVDLAAQYTINLSDQKNFTIGATFSPSLPSSGKSSRLIANGSSIGIENELFSINDTIKSNTTKWRNVDFNFPSKIGVGVSYNIKDKLTLAADYSLQKWASVVFPDSMITKTADASKLALGVEWTPNERTGTKYIQRIRYRAGFHYANEYIMVDNNQLKNYGVSVGIGLPLRRSKTSISIGYEYGNRGTFEKDAHKEVYQRISLSLTMHEFWFIKRKFN